jgi:hypothetical protein
MSVLHNAFKALREGLFGAPSMTTGRYLTTGEVAQGLAIKVQAKEPLVLARRAAEFNGGKVHYLQHGGDMTICGMKILSHDKPLALVTKENGVLNINCPTCKERIAAALREGRVIRIARVKKKLESSSSMHQSVIM